MIEYRPIRYADYDRLEQLYMMAADSGSLQIGVRYRVPLRNLLQQFTHNVQTVVADHHEHGLVGAGSVLVDDMQVNGSIRTVAYLSSLVVHPDFRRQGIGTQLANWRIEYAKAQVDDNALILAAIQSGNDGSFRITDSWAVGNVGALESTLLKTRRQRPKAIGSYQVREVEPDEFGRFAECSNHFFQTHNFYTPLTAKSLKRWRDDTPFEKAYRTFIVVENEQGEWLAGMAVAEEYRVREMVVTNLPAVVRILNYVLRIVPSSGVLRPLTTRLFWFSAENLQAARHLWEMARYIWRDRADVISHSYDPNSLVAQAVNAPRWLPKGKLTLVASDTNLAPAHVCMPS